MLRNTSCEQLDLFQYVEYHRIPKNHILLKIDSEISLGFVNDLLADKYHKTLGRPACKPEIMVRICILQRIYPLSDEAVIDEIAVNRAFEYFCHISPMDKLPHPVTCCQGLFNTLLSKITMRHLKASSKQLFISSFHSFAHSRLFAFHLNVKGEVKEMPGLKYKCKI